MNRGEGDQSVLTVATFYTTGNYQNGSFWIQSNCERDPQYVFTQAFQNPYADTSWMNPEAFQLSPFEQPESGPGFVISGESC